MAAPRYPTREEIAAGAEPITAVPRSPLLTLMTSGAGHILDKACVYCADFSFISWEASRLRGIPYQPSLLLTTTGRKSGRPRTVVLPYVRDGARYIVVGSNAGRAHNPQWVENARVNSACRIRVKKRDSAALASIPEGDARDALIDIVAHTRPHIHNYDAHAKRHGRRLELVVLTPEASTETRQ